MFRSAAVNLRNMLGAYPEMIPVQFSAKYLPRGERLDAIRAQLRLRGKQTAAIAPHAGFLLAFVGFQTAEPADIEDGMAMIQSARQAEGGGLDALERVCRTLWLQDAEPAR